MSAPALAILSWHLLAERSPFNEAIASFRVSYRDGGPEFSMMLALAPGSHPPAVVRAWQVVTGAGSAPIEPASVPYHIRDLAQSACMSRQDRR